MDNAYPVEKSYNKPFDHQQRYENDEGRQYKYESAEKLLTDFWLSVDKKLMEL